MAYKVFERSSVRVDQPSVSIGPSGAMRLNAAACRIIMQAGIKSVTLLWDSNKRKVAFKAASKADTNAYAVSIVRSTGTVRAKSFLDFVGWNPPERRMLPATWNERERMLEFAIPAGSPRFKKSPGPGRKEMGRKEMERNAES